MNFSLTRTTEILERTPQALMSLLSGLSDEWSSATEGGESWSPFDVMAHLVHCERTDWMVRTEIILSDNPVREFAPFDPAGHAEDALGKDMSQLLSEFRLRREANLARLRQINPGDLDKTGVHPIFGEVSLAQLLAAWTVHDLNHIHQIVRTMSAQYSDEVGPWHQFLGILNPRK